MKRLCILLTTFLLCSAYAWAQDPNNLAVDGSIKDENGGRITGASIVLYQDGQEIERVNTGKNGRFDLYLDFGHEFIIEISKPNYVTKKLYINTNNVPEDEQAWGYEFGGFVVDMFKRLDGVDYSILEQPIGKVYYEPNVENFVADRVYTNQIKQEVDRLEEEQKRRQKEEEERLKRLEQDFQLAIKDAEAAIADGDYLLAKDNLLAAQNLKPSSNLPKQMLAEVNAKLEDEGAKEEQYMSLLATADQAYGNGDFLKAIADYEAALKIKPDESYPKDQIKLSKEKQATEEAKAREEALLADKDRKYNEAIAQADKAYADGNYRDARTYYQNALAQKESEHPRAQLKLIEQKLQEMAATEKEAQDEAAKEARYNDKIDKADAAFKSGNLEMAKSHYQEALEIKATERYPKDQIAAIDQQLKERAARLAEESKRKELDEQYTSLVQAGDRLFKVADLQNAKQKFQDALELKPDQAYPMEQIAAIEAEEKRLAEVARQEQLNKTQGQAYQGHIDEGSRLFNAGKFKEAREQYVAALEIRPEESLPKSQIARIDSELERQEREKEKDIAYNAAIKEGDALFAQKDWNAAITAYTKASEIKPSEYYPAGRIAEAQKQIDQAALAAATQKAKEEKEAAFNALVKAGDEAYARGDLKGAVNKYDQALRIRADDYAKSQIEKINKEIEAELLADKKARQQAELDKLYNEAIERGDGQFARGEYASAKETFNVAAGYKPDEDYPKERLAAIEVKLAELAELKRNEEARKAKRAEYEQLLKVGNENIASGAYEEARGNFNQALALFPEEEIPQRKLELIADLIERQKVAERQANYQAAVNKADRAFMAESYEEAIPLYEAASNIKPEESYPKERIKKINEILQELANAAKQADEDSRKRVIEETYDEGRTKVTIRRVMVNGKEDVYKRVIHSWGGKYYFLNEQPITELVWNRETVK